LHQDVLASPSLSASESIQAQLALAKDYLAAGLLDRAEMLLLDIVSQTTEEERDTALRLLTDLYQREKEWEKALSASLQLGDHEDLMLFKQQAHFYCELAEYAIGQKAYKEAKGILRRALERDRNCVRASLLLAEIEMLKECYRQALKPLKQAFKQDGAYIPLVVDRLTACYRQLGNHGELKRCLNDYMAVIPSTSVMLQLAEEISREKGDYVAGAYITEQLKRRPSIRGFNRLIDLHIKHASESGRESLEILRGLTGQLEQSKPVYRCVSCGFSGKVLHWQCPSCRSWESIKPIRGLEGE
jgi:lipopolysaccharide biosynthesis regulator YciM